MFTHQKENKGHKSGWLSHRFFEYRHYFPEDLGHAVCTIAIRELGKLRFKEMPDRPKCPECKQSLGAALEELLDGE